MKYCYLYFVFFLCLFCGISCQTNFLGKGQYKRVIMFQKIETKRGWDILYFNSPKIILVIETLKGDIHDPPVIFDDSQDIDKDGNAVIGVGNVSVKLCTLGKYIEIDNNRYSIDEKSDFIAVIGRRTLLPATNQNELKKIIQECINCKKINASDVSLMLTHIENIEKLP